MTKNLDIGEWATFKQENGCELQIHTGPNGLQVKTPPGFYLHASNRNELHDKDVWLIELSGQPLASASDTKGK